MNDQTQKIIDSTRRCMEQAHNGVAATRILHSFVAVLSRQFLTEDQQEQIESILDFHMECIQGRSDDK